MATAGKSSILAVLAPRLRTRFNADLFLSDPDIDCSLSSCTPAELLTYYVPRYVKHTRLDDRLIDDIVGDPSSRPITLARAARQPSRWDLALPASKLPQADELYPIIIARDTATSQTLILDSNHTLAALVYTLPPDQTVPAYVIAGPRLARLVPDFAKLALATKQPT